MFISSRLHGHALAALLLGLCGSAAALAADNSCAALNKAVSAGMAQARVHAAIDSPLDAAALKAGMKPTLLHSIVIDKVQHSNALNPRFSRVPVADAGQRELATDLAAFQAESGCQALGRVHLAGRSAVLYAFSTDLGRGRVRVQLWVDSSSGLPLRATSDEPDFDFDVDVAWKKPVATQGASPKLDMLERANGKRLVSTHAYLYGSVVLAPDVQGAVNPAALSQLQALLKGAP